MTGHFKRFVDDLIYMEAAPTLSANGMNVPFNVQAKRPYEHRNHSGATSV